MPDVVRVPFDRLIDACADRLAAAGVCRADARIAARAIVEADLRGHASHGVRLLPGYLTRLRAGGINPRPRQRMLRDAPAAAVLDGDGGLGHVVATRAMEVAVAKARVAGIGSCAVAHSSHFGIAAVYAEIAAGQGMVGIALSNSIAVMPPPGGAEARVGTCALAYAVPGDREPGLAADLSMSIAARGRILDLEAAGRRLPEGWALDAEGRPTVEPGIAAGGLLLPVGGHKGFALALLVDVLAGSLSGSRAGAGLVRPGPAERVDVGHAMLAFDPAAFGPPERFGDSVDGIVRGLRSTRAREGEEVRVPGDRSRAIRERNLREGVPLPTSLLRELGLADAL